MKPNFFSFILGVFIMGMLTSCDPDKTGGNDPQPVTPIPPVSFENSLTYFSAQGRAFSAVEFSDVTLCEIHSDIADFELTCNSPEGYKIFLKKLSNKDNADFYVYRIVADMSTISKITSSNEMEEIEIKYSLSGNGYTDGNWGKKSYNNSLIIYRYLMPGKTPDEIYHNWYLAEHEIVDNLNRMVFEDKYTFSETKISSQFGVTNSPLTINYHGFQKQEFVNEYGELITKKDVMWDTSCEKDLPGWVSGKSVMLKTELNESRPCYYSYPDDFGSSVYFLSSDQLLTMKGEYDSNGNLLKIHYYKFFQKTVD